VAACGSTSDEPEGKKTTTTENKAPENAKTGGKLTVLWAGDVDFIDCGRTYSQMGVFVCQATEKALYSYKPDDPTNMVPDLAEGPPEVSADGKTVTVKIKQGVKYSPPYAKEVKAADVKYAIERGFFSSVANGFTSSYYGDLEGAKVGVDAGTTIEGITTPDDYTVVFKFKRAVGGSMAAGALGYPATAPVPEEWAKKFDAEPTSTYGENQLSTGPYMIENDANGKAIGYDPGKRIHLVRNPNWDKNLDYKPAYLDEIDNLAQRRSGHRLAPHPRRSEHDQRRLRAAAREPQGRAGQPARAAQARPRHRRPLGRAEHDDQAVRRRERPQGDQRGHGPQRPAPDPRRPDHR